MSGIITIQNDQLVTTTLAIAEGTSNDHASVIKLVRTYQGDLEEFGGVGFEIQPFETAGGMQEREVAILNEQQSTLILTYMRNTEIIRTFKKRLVKDFWEMRNQQVTAPAFAIPQTFAAALRLASEQAERIEVLAIERDKAIATKAQIGSKREATAMATASTAKREAARLKDELGVNQRHATIIAVEKALGEQLGSQYWRKLKAWSQEHGMSATKVVDPRWGEVKAWPAEAWKAVKGIDLASLFPPQPGMQS